MDKKFYSQTFLKNYIKFIYYYSHFNNKDGKCKHMDANADGYARAEACATIFLQRKSDAKRIYGTVIHAKTNTDGNKSEGITFPSKDSQKRLMQDVCDEAKIDPHLISYVEMHGTGTKAGMLKIDQS